ncbi:transposase [Streptomyces anulatus]|uniref:transposase n=1 Tax=Streptomyces anulatus TaxID=1892 RepID=UPI0036CA718E
MILAAKAYSSLAVREHLRRRGIRAVIPVPADQQGHRTCRGSRPPTFDRKANRQRNTVERCINQRKQWRGIATRREKTATVHLAGLHITAIPIRSARRPVRSDLDESRLRLRVAMATLPLLGDTV